MRSAHDAHFAGLWVSQCARNDRFVPANQVIAEAKFRNVKTDGYHSKREAKRAVELKLLESGGYITGLREQVSYILIPAQYVDGKCVERACTYIADFVYAQDGREVVEDAKGVRTIDYIIKRKLMLMVHGIRVREV